MTASENVALFSTHGTSEIEARMDQIMMYFAQVDCYNEFTIPENVTRPNDL